MADSKRQKIVTVIKEAIEQISTANDYQTDIGANVEDWRTDWDDDELPGTSICDLSETPLENQANEHMEWYSLPVQIRTFLSSDTRAADARKMMADIVKVLGTFKDGVRVDNKQLFKMIELKRKGFVLAEDGFKIAAVAVEIEILYYTQRFNDYE